MIILSKWNVVIMIFCCIWKCTYISARVILQRVDGEVNVKIELQTESQGFRILDLRGYVFFPQLKEHLVVPIVEAAKQVSLLNKNQRALEKEEASEMLTFR